MSFIEVQLTKPADFEANNYILADDNKILNERHIHWVQKMNECLYVCTKSTGCAIKQGDTHKICKINSPFSYQLLNNHFAEKKE